MVNEPEERKTTFQDLLSFVENCEGNNASVGNDFSSREQEEINTRTNQKDQQAPYAVTYDNGSAQQQQNLYVVGKTDSGTHLAATGMIYMPFIRMLGYLNQTSLLRKDFKIRRAPCNTEPKDCLSFVSLSRQINNGKTTEYSEMEIMVGRYSIPFKTGESVVTCVLTRKSGNQTSNHTQNI